MLLSKVEDSCRKSLQKGEFGQRKKDFKKGRNFQKREEFAKREFSKI
jgi:hypothetical protein